MTKETEVQDVPQDALTPPGTVKARYLLASGNVADFFFHGNTHPTQLDNLVENAILFDEIATEKGLISANQTAGAKAVAGAGLEALKTQFGVREGNDLFHVVSIDVEPRMDGRTKVGFFGDTFKQPRDDWARASLLLPPADLQTALAPYYEFKQDTLEKPGRFKVDFYVETYESKELNSVGKPYINVPRGGIHVKDDAEKPVKEVYQEKTTESAPPPPPPAPPTGEEFAAGDDIPF